MRWSSDLVMVMRDAQEQERSFWRRLGEAVVQSDTDGRLQPDMMMTDAGLISSVYRHSVLGL